MYLIFFILLDPIILYLPLIPRTLNKEVKLLLKSLIFLFDKLKSGGLYVIEDVQDIDSTAENFLSFNPNVQIFDFRNIKNRKDDIIIQILK